MDAASLTRDLGNLEKSWSSLDWWLNFWTILVVIGVALEVLILVAEFAHEWSDFKRGTIHTPDRPNIVLFSLGLMGAALVAIGVAGEFQVHTIAGKIETDLRDKTRALVAIVQKEADDAKERAARLDLASVDI